MIDNQNQEQVLAHAGISLYIIYYYNLLFSIELFHLFDRVTMNVKHKQSKYIYANDLNLFPIYFRLSH